MATATWVELVGDLRLNNRVYVATEFGSERKTQQSEQINFTNGSYIKVGLDYNFFTNWKGMNNALYGGFRLAKSLHTHRVNNYTLYQTNQYLPINTTEGFLVNEINSAVAGSKSYLEQKFNYFQTFMPV